MKNIVCVFPGQGSQYVGMGDGYSDNELFTQANETLGFNLKGLCLEGPEEKLKLTENTQPAIITHSVILFNELRKKDIKPSLVLGHSVGEFAALVAAGAMEFSDAILAVHNRGKFMQAAVPVGKGGMTAILRAEDQDVQSACDAASNTESFCSVANFNSPGQVVISGHLDALERAVQYLKDREIKHRAVPLPVSAPFHCALMDSAADQLNNHLNSLKFKPLEVPYVANIDAKEYSQNTSKQVLVDNLTKQVSGSVLWTQSLKSIPENSLVIEVGPGKALKGLVKKTRPDLEVYSLDADGFDWLN